MSRATAPPARDTIPPLGAVKRPHHTREGERPASRWFAKDRTRYRSITPNPVAAASVVRREALALATALTATVNVKLPAAYRT